MSVIKNTLYATTVLAALTPTVALAAVIEISRPIGKAGTAVKTAPIPVIVVEGDASGYNTVVTKTLNYYIRLKARKPENYQYFRSASISIEDETTEISEDISGSKIYLVKAPVMDLRAWSVANLRLSPIKLCNDELARAQGTGRQKFLENGRKMARHSAYKVSARVKWMSGDADQEQFRSWFAKDFLIPVSIDCRPLVLPAAKPYSVDLRVTQQGAVCPRKVEVRAFIRYRRSATAKFRFKVNGELSELVEIKARKVSNQPDYLVERVKYYNLDPGRTNFRIEVRGGEKSKVKTVNISCRGAAQPLSPEAINEALEKKKPKLSLKIAPMNIKRVGKDICPTQLRLNGRFDVGKAFEGTSIFMAPSWLSRKTEIRFQKAGGRNIVATYPIKWGGGVSGSLSSNAGKKPKRQTITFKMNLADKNGKFVKSVSKQIKIICKKPSPGAGNSAGDLSSGATNPPQASTTNAAAACKGVIKAKGKSYRKKKKAISSARGRWGLAATAKFDASYSQWKKAKGKSMKCTSNSGSSGKRWNCTARARVCK